jgi:NAD dependent epimerase/dehydratase family
MRAPRPACGAGTWKGGREKAPAAFCRKVLTSKNEIEMWGDGKQTRSFTFIDDCVEGILRITKVHPCCLLPARPSVPRCPSPEGSVCRVPRCSGRAYGF